MRGLDSFDIDIKQCWVELEEFENLLRNNRELNERKDILPFFKERLHLSACIGWYPSDNFCNQIKHEFTLFGEFRADLVVGDSINNIYCFIEFEDATKNSIFVNKKGKTTSEWSSRFENGFSQIIDWFWKLDDFKNTGQFRSIFGSENIEYQGILVIGRDEFLSEVEKTRLKWYLNRVVVDSRKVICKTFDQLARDTRNRLLRYQKML
jgi:hypothetical protein